MSIQQQNSMILQGLLNRKEWSKALAVLDQQVQLEPHERQWYLVRASVLIKSGEVQAGIDGLELLTREFPDFLDAWVNLGQTRKALGDYSAAYAAYLQALRLGPEHILARRGAAECAQILGADHEELAHWQVLAKVGEPDPDVCLRLAICQLESKPREAIAAAKTARTLSPERADICYVLAQAYVNNEHFELALPLFEGLTGQSGWEVAGLKGKVACLLYQGDCDAAFMELELFRQAGGEELDACLLEAKAWIQLGERQSALTAYQNALAEDNTCIDAWYGLLNIDSKAVTEIDIANLESGLSKLSSQRDRMLAAFCVARWYEAHGALTRQMHWLHLANEDRQALRPFDNRELSTRYKLVSRVCTDNWYSQMALSEPSTSDLTPVFICGMPRSGTTLVEQTLATYPQVTARGENRAHVQAIGLIAETLSCRDSATFLNRLDRRAVSIFRDHYQRILVEKEGVHTPLFTSKSMNLVFNLGLLLAAFPDAKVIWVRRHPLDVGLGCYKQYFAQGQAFSGSWRGIACYYATFEKLMVHWSSIFPGAILPISYESLISDPEAVTSRIATHCGLEWELSMLDFQQNKGVVTTASAMQVREGLFSSASGRWERYGGLLHSLMEELEREGVDWQSYDNNKEG